jgi:hypothetical protein
LRDDLRAAAPQSCVPAPVRIFNRQIEITFTTQPNIGNAFAVAREHDARTLRRDGSDYRCREWPIHIRQLTRQDSAARLHCAAAGRPKIDRQWRRTGVLFDIAHKTVVAGAAASKKPRAP